MKKQLILTMLAGWLALPLAVRAQTSTNAAPPPRGDHGPMAGLTKEEREQVRAAHDKAVEQDPTLEQKMEAAHKAMYDAMIAVDPAVAPILDKMKPRKWGRNQGGGPDQKGKRIRDERGGEPRHGPPGIANLTEGEREQLKALHEQVKANPTVSAAHEELKRAATPQARRSAEEALKKASHDAMVKLDPTIEPILEKLRAGSVKPAPDTTPAMQ